MSCLERIEGEWEKWAAMGFIEGIEEASREDVIRR
jgi:hypothetical protein